MPRLLVTGAGGYLGGVLVSAAVTEPGWSVRSVVRSPAPWLPGEVIVTDSLEEGSAEAVEGADCVVHLAGPNEVVTRDDPDRALAETVSAGRAVAHACRDAAVPRLIYVSTVHVYGAALASGRVVDEQTVPEPRHDYAIARLACEHTMASAAGADKMVVFRLTNGVGPPADPRVRRWSLVANDLCSQAAAGGPLKLLSAGYQWRDFVALEDVSRIILRSTSTGNVPSGTYNLGSGRPMTVRELAELVADESVYAGIERPSIEVPEQAGARPLPPPVVATGALTRLGLEATTPVSKAVADTLRFCLDRGSGP